MHCEHGAFSLLPTRGGKQKTARLAKIYGPVLELNSFIAQKGDIQFIVLQSSSINEHKPDYMSQKLLYRIVWAKR
jgi:hypothetical protein